LILESLRDHAGFAEKAAARSDAHLVGTDFNPSRNEAIYAVRSRIESAVETQI
jgi:hypothetical protein